MQDDSPEWIEVCARDHAWELAIEYFLQNGFHEFSHGRTERCVSTGMKARMKPHCWEVLKAQYPVADE